MLRELTKVEHNAVLTGLRLLQEHLQHGQPLGHLRDILTDGSNTHISPSGIDTLCEALNFGSLHTEDN